MKKTLILLNSNNFNIINIKNLHALPQKLNSVLIGIMLGDGSLYKSSPTSNTRFEMSFGENIKLLLKA